MKNLLYIKIKLSLIGIEIKKFILLMKKRIKSKQNKKRLFKSVRRSKQSLKLKKKIFNNSCNQFLNKKLIFKLKKIYSKLNKQLIIS